MTFESKLKIGSGIYPISEIAKILGLPYYKVNSWISRYWDDQFRKELNYSYTWKVGKSKAVDFYTLVELYALILLSEAGVKTREIIKARLELSKIYDTPFPFAQKKIIESIKTDGKKIFFRTGKGTISLDGTKQFQIDFIKIFFKNLEFDKELLANRFYPLGKNKKIIVDPSRQFGLPVVGETNIYPETIYNLHKAGEPTKFIAYMYEIGESEVLDAIEYCNKAA